MKVVFSGIQPSGNLHIGNYLGAIKQWVELQKTHRVFIMIADLHAITVAQEPEELRKKTLEVAGLLVACGIDPKKSILFVQSHVPAHAELAWILNTITPVGELERMTQFKEKSEKAVVFAGLLNYPVLQASDILLYQSEVVPVGKDQLQHIELTRTLARRFNNRFGKTFTIPRPLILKESECIMGLDDPSKKMSKSASNRDAFIALLDPPAEIHRKIKTAVTDSGKEIRYDPSSKPAVSNLLTIYRAFSGMSLSEITKRYASTGYAEFKEDLARLVIEKLTPIQTRYRKLIKEEKNIRGILQEKAHSAAKIAEDTLRNAKEKMGLLPPLDH